MFTNGVLVLLTFSYSFGLFDIGSCPACLHHTPRRPHRNKMDWHWLPQTALRC